MKQGFPQGFAPHVTALEVQRSGDDGRGSDQVGDVGLEFLIGPHLPRLPLDDEVEQREVHACQEHEHQDDGLQSSGVPVTDAVVGGRETSAWHRGQAVIHGLERVHGRQADEQRNFEEGQHEVHDPQRLRCLRKLGAQAREGRAGQFCPCEGHPTAQNAGKDHHAEHDDTHASQPLHG